MRQTSNGTGRYGGFAATMPVLANPENEGRPLCQPNLTKGDNILPPVMIRGLLGASSKMCTLPQRKDKAEVPVEPSTNGSLLKLPSLHRVKPRNTSAAKAKGKVKSHRRERGDLGSIPSAGSQNSGSGADSNLDKASTPAEVGNYATRCSKRNEVCEHQKERDLMFPKITGRGFLTTLTNQTPERNRGASPLCSSKTPRQSSLWLKRESPSINISIDLLSGMVPARVHSPVGVTTSSPHAAALLLPLRNADRSHVHGKRRRKGLKKKAQSVNVISEDVVSRSAARRWREHFNRSAVKTMGDTKSDVEDDDSYTEDHQYVTGNQDCTGSSLNQCQRRDQMEVENSKA